jgi:hypothetical protein
MKRTLPFLVLLGLGLVPQGAWLRRSRGNESGQDMRSRRSRPPPQDAEPDPADRTRQTESGRTMEIAAAGPAFRPPPSALRPLVRAASGGLRAGSGPGCGGRGREGLTDYKHMLII